jgi:flagellar motor protein MotB
MRRVPGGTILFVLAASALAGCNQNPYVQSPLAGFQPPAANVPPYQAQMYDLSRRAESLDANNRDLNTQLAQSRQQVQLLREQLALLQKQLADAARQLQESQVARDESDKKLQSLQTTATRRGGAVITANNSLRQTLRRVDISGLETREDADTLRIELPTDQLFAPGSAQLVGAAFPILDRVATEIQRNYPRQLIGIEGHTDGAPLYGDVSTHSLATAQALAVFEQFTRRNRLPAKQFVVVGQGANRPLSTNGTQVGRTKNRRVELIVYPELVEGGQ